MERVDAYKENAATAGMEIDGNLWDLQEMLEQAFNLDEERRNLFIEKAGKASLERLVRLHETTCGQDVAKVAGLTEDRIREVSQKVTCLYGQHSPFLPMCNKIGEVMQNCTMDMIPDAQHFAFEENPTVFIDRVEHHFCEMSGLEPTAPALEIEGVRKNVMTDQKSV